MDKNRHKLNINLIFSICKRSSQHLLGLCLLGLIASVSAQPQSVFNNSLNSGIDLNSLADQDFLPVKQAYRPHAWFDDSDLIIEWTIAPDYYLYKDRTFFTSASLQFQSAVFEQGDMIDDEFYEKPMEVYRQSTHMRLTNIRGADLLVIEAQGCADAGLCYPPTDFWFSIDSETQNIRYHQQQPEALMTAYAGDNLSTNTLLSGAVSSLLIALIMAFAGGLILNLMPCVFPVLTIKALEIASAADDFASRAKEATAYTAGILTTVITIAAILIAVRAGGAQVGWGFQLQSPAIVMALTALFFIVGLSFSGWIELGARLAGIGQSLTQQDRPLKSFFTGVLAMVVASPCSAPFMAVALGYAISQPAAVSLVVFVSLGLGMAAPMILLYMIPSINKLLPRPGPWMIRLKQFLAFPMYLTCIWLIWILIAQIGATGAAMTMAALCLLALAIWAYNRSESNWSKWVAAGSFFTALSLGFYAIEQTPTQRGAHQNFTVSALDNQIAGNRPVFVDVTADWCITCKFNESRVLYSTEIQTLFEREQVIYVVADWTNKNAEISALLDRYQRVGIPLYLYFAPGKRQPQILPQILTKKMLNALFI